MKSSKVMAALVSLGLAAAVASPAMALENQFSGSFTTFYDLSNYSAAGNDGSATATNATGLANNAPTENYFVQRVRLGYNAKASESAKLVTLFQIDYKYWGKDSYAASLSGGSALGSRGLNIQTKNIYLDLNLPGAVNTKIGMQPVSDAFKGSIMSADAAGILFSHDYAKASASAGFFRMGDSFYLYGDNYKENTSTKTVGRNTYDLFILDAKYSINKETKVGAAYYFIADNRQNSATAVQPTNKAKVSTLGVNAETIVGPLTVNGFALTQFGDKSDGTKAKGYAFNFGAKIPLAGGTARTEFIYTSGGAEGSLVIPSSVNGTEGGGFYDNEMVILSRDKNATNFDNAIIYDVNNVNQGVVFGSLGYDYTFSPKLSGSANAGFAAVARDRGAHNSNYLGSEINCEANYKLLPEVTLGARVGYVFLGDYFKTSPSVDNPYDLKIIAKYSF